MTRHTVVLAKPNNIISKVAMILTLLLGLAYMINVSETLKTFAGFAFLVVLLMMPSVDSIKYLMFILCANELINIGTTSLTMIFVAIFFVVHCFLSIRKLKINVGVILGILLLLLLSITSYMATGATEPIISTIKHLFFLYYIGSVLNESQGRWLQLYTKAFQYIAAGILYFGLLSITINGLPSLTERFTFSEEITINFIAIVCALAIVNLLYIVWIIKSKSKINIPLIIGCILVGLLTQSRSFILAVAIGIVLLLLLTSSLTKKFKYITIGAVCLIVGIVIVSNIPILAERIDVVLSRIITPEGDDISNGRYDLWSSTVAAMTENPVFFWLGAGDYSKVGAMFNQKVMVAHNLFLETWVIYGVIGCAFLIIIYIFYIKHHLFTAPKKKLEAISFVPLIVMLCCLFYSHHFIGRSMSIVFVLSFLPIALGIKRENGEIR